MPDRLIRDELLTSERYWSVSPEARNLFLSFVLSADDTARCPASNFVIRTKFMAGTVSPERAEKLLSELQDIDLVRVYENGGSRFVFVPRFGQRLRYIHSKHPEPPLGISDLTKKKTDSGQTPAKPKSVRSEEKLREVKNNTHHASADADSFARFWDAYPRKGNRKRAQQAWENLRPSVELQNVMTLAVQAQAKSEQWQRGVIPGAANWIKDRRWEDDVTATATSSDLGQCDWNCNGNRDPDAGQCTNRASQQKGRNVFCDMHAPRVLA